MDSSNCVTTLDILKTIDPRTFDISGYANYVKLYQFCFVKNVWEFNNIEGEFIICDRIAGASNCFHIINHQQKRAHTVSILKDMNWEIRAHIILYREDEINYAIEISDKEEFLTISALLASILESSGYVSERELIPRDILALIAQRDFERVSSLFENELRGAEDYSCTNNEAAASSSGAFRNPQKLHPSNHQTINSSEKEMKDLEKMTSTMSLGKKNKEKPVPITPKFFETGAKKKEVKKDSAKKLEKPEPINHRELMEALIYLLTNDEGFGQQIHETYKKAFKKML